eukprot:765635-Hanusia_phi.AAC.3
MPDRPCTAGIEKVFLVIRPDDRHAFEKLFSGSLPSAREFNKLPLRQQSAARRLTELAKVVKLVTQARGGSVEGTGTDLLRFQEEQLGLGHAILCCR